MHIWSFFRVSWIEVTCAYTGTLKHYYHSKIIITYSNREFFIHCITNRQNLLLKKKIIQIKMSMTKSGTMMMIKQHFITASTIIWQESSKFLNRSPVPQMLLEKSLQWDRRVRAIFVEDHGRNIYLKL